MRIKQKENIMDIEYEILKTGTHVYSFKNIFIDIYRDGEEEGEVGLPHAPYLGWSL